MYHFLWLQGLIESILGLHLLVGIFVRITACVALFVLGVIIGVVGFAPIGIRDMGLFFASLAILFLGAGEWSLDACLKKMDMKNAPPLEGS